MPGKEKRPPSLRRRLLTTTLLAVLSGYGLLLLVQRGVSSEARVQAHEQSVELVWVGLEEGKTYKLPNPNKASPQTSPIVKLIARADTAAELKSTPQEFELDGNTYVTSRQPIQLEGRPAQLRFVDDFSASAQQERMAQLLLHRCRWRAHRAQQLHHR